MVGQRLSHLVGESPVVSIGGSLSSGGISMAVGALKAFQNTTDRGPPHLSCRQATSHHDPQWDKPLQCDPPIFYQDGQEAVSRLGGVREVIWGSQCP